MKRLFCVLLLFSLSYSSAAQVAIGIEDMNILYVNVENPLTIAVEGKPTKNLIFTSDNGTIKGENGHYIIIPNHISDSAAIIIFEKTKGGKKEIGKKYFKVKCITQITAYLYNSKDGEISESAIHEADRLVVNVPGFECTSAFTVTYFTIIVVRNYQEIFRKTIGDGHHKAHFSEDAETESVIKHLQPGDKLKLINISCGILGPECSEPLEPLEFTIVK